MSRVDGSSLLVGIDGSSLMGLHLCLGRSLPQPIE